ncbi:hypothetical protein U1Q18_036530 [Sarracenia purpurea var. burkii]
MPRVTNRPDELDLEFVRPGRIDHRLYIGLPDAKLRVQIFGVHSAGKHLAEDVGFEQLDDHTVDALMSKLFKNYKTWCKFLGRKCNLGRGCGMLNYAKHENFSNETDRTKKENDSIANCDIWFADMHALLPWKPSHCPKYCSQLPDLE